MNRKSVRVIDFPNEKIFLLLLHLESSRYNGGNVSTTVEGVNFVDVEFEEERVAQNFLIAGVVTVDGRDYKVVPVQTSNEEYNYKMNSLQITGLPPALTDFHLLLYLEGKTEASQDSIKILNFDPKEKYATCYFNNCNELDKFLQIKQHEISGCRLTCVRIRDDLADFKKMSCGIKVWMSPILQDFMLKIVYEKHGHEIENIYTNKGKQTATITYKTPNGIEQYVGNCSLENHKLKAEIMIPKFSPSKGQSDDILSDCFILTNLPLLFENENLLNYFKTHLKDGEILNVFYARSNPGATLVVFKFHKDFDLIQRLVYSKPFCDKMLGIKQVDKPKSILVSNISGISGKSLKSYFKGEKFHKKQIKDEFFGDEFAILTFENSSLEEIIDYGDHNLDGKKLHVSLHYEDFGIICPGENSTCWLQKCFSVKCDPHFINFLIKSEKDRRSFEENLAQRCGVIEWPTNLLEDEKPVELRILLGNHQSLDIEQLKTWKSNCLKLFNKLRQSFSVYQVNLQKELASCVIVRLFDKLDKPEWIDKIGTGEMKMCGDVIIITKEDHLILSGPKLSVDKVRSTIEELESEEKGKLHISLSMVTKEMFLAQVQISYMKQKQLLKSFNVHVDFDASKNCLILKGLQVDVIKAELEIHQLLTEAPIKHLKCETLIVELLRDHEEILKHFEDEFLRNNLTVAIFFDKYSASFICASNDSEIMQALSILNSGVKQREIPLDKNKLETLNRSEWEEKLTEFKRNSRLEVVVDKSHYAIILKGLTGEVDDAENSINFYFENHAIYYDEVIFPRGKMLFMEKHMISELKQLLKEHDNDSVDKVEISPDGTCFQMKGTRPNLELVKQKISEMFENIKLYRKVISKVGFEAYIESQEGKLSLDIIGKNTETYIERYDAMVEEREIDSSISGNIKYASIFLTQNTTLNVVLGSILNSNVDVIVNAANNKLQHVGGVAKIISKAAGPEVQKECDSYINKNNEVKVGGVFVSTPGCLKFKAIVHAVGPTYSKDIKNHDQLYEVVKNILTIAEQNGWNKIALPAISTGIFGYPLKVATPIILNCISNFVGDSKHLKLIEIVDIKPDVVRAFQACIKEEFSGNEILFFKDISLVKNVDIVVNDRSRDAPFERLTKENQFSQNKTSSLKYSRLKFVKGSLIDQKVDAIVNSASCDLNLQNGMISHLIYKKAGPEIQKSCDEYIASHGNLNYGDICVSPGFLLPCQFVFHGVCAPFTSNNSEMSIRLLTKKSLEEANKKKLKSMAMPSFGSGRLKVPANLMVKWMYEETDSFFSNNPNNSLVDLRLVVFDKDYKVIEEIEKFLKCEVTTSSRNERRLLKTNTNQGSDNEMGFTFNISKLVLEVCLGDLTSETTDAIVNGTNTTFDLSGGAVSRAILEKGGPQILEECLKFGKLDTIEVTSAGTLPCKYIFHVNLEKYLDAMKECLSMAEKLKLSSLSFPLLMTGRRQYSLSSVTKSMFEIFEKFAEGGIKHLVKVRVVAFDRNKMEGMREMLKEPKGWTQKFKNYLTSKCSYSLQEYTAPKSFTTDICIYALSSKDADKAEIELNDALSTTIKEKVINDWGPAVSKLDDKECTEIMNLEKEGCVRININKGSKNISLIGTSASVSKFQSKIIDILKNVQERITLLEETEKMYSQVMWYYKTIEYINYPKEINLIIEKAFSEKKSHKVSWKEEIGHYEIDFGKMKELCRLNSTCVPVKRITSSHIYPVQWDFASENLKLFTVPLGSKEYEKVKRNIMISSGNTFNSIIKIERIQNSPFYQQYHIKKEELRKEHSNSKIIIEHILWHAVTQTDNINDINTNGFNRFKDIKPAHAAQLGQGSYFFKCFSDIHQALPNADGERLAYQCLVLTGRYANGSQSLKDVPKDDNGPIFNSAVDDVNNPTTHIIFHDNQAYPEYLIHYN